MNICDIGTFVRKLSDKDKNRIMGRDFLFTYSERADTESEQVYELIIYVPLGITETKRKTLCIFFKFQ